MVSCNETEGTVEIWDLTVGGDEPPKESVTIVRSLTIGELIKLALSRFKHDLGTIGLLLKWGRNKVDLMDAKNDLTIGDIGVDFTPGTTYTLLITGCPISPSKHDEPIKPGDTDTIKLNEVGVDLSSQTNAMLLVEVTSESPTETVSEASTPTDDDPPEYARQCARRAETHTSQTEKQDTTKGWAVEEDMGPSLDRKQISSRAKGRRTMKYVLLKPTDMVCKEVPDLVKEEQTLDRGNIGRRFAVQGNEESEPNRRAETGYVGLVNQAMTCYLNSLLQALYMTPEFRNALYNWEWVNEPEKDEAKSIPYQLQKLFLNLQTSSKNAIETTSLTKSFGWDSTQAWQQHDIQELCRVMFDALEQKFKNTEQADLINRLYEGKMIDYVKCLECGTEKSREDTFLDIPLPVRPFGSNVAYNSVEEALGAFVQPETLDGTNQYHCETCNKKCDAHKGLKFTKFPYFLTLHLKRFDFDYNTFHRIKLNDEVTFPDLLNLNSFIPSSTSDDSACSEEFSSVGATKGDDCSTTDNGTILDDDSLRRNNGISVSENSINVNNDAENADEGINRSNGPSALTCNSHNHENDNEIDDDDDDDEKNRDNLPGQRGGPYVYELFSIMIHSGSASGGHYYAYIKDFRTGEWLCFNDQNVSTITTDDIRKTYGGGPTRAYYSGVYSSSSNAYMLMYRQIDPVRNALPMQVADFPKHLQELLIKMQDGENNKKRESQNQIPLMYRIKVSCYHPINKKIVRIKIICHRDTTWCDLTDRAYKGLEFGGTIDRDQVRLVTYQESSGLIDCSFEDRQDDKLSSILGDCKDLLMEVRKKDETFQTYLPGDVAKKIYVIDVTTKEVTKGPINFRGHLTQTIQEYKEKLGPAIGMEPKDINLVLQSSKTRPSLVTNDKATLQDEDFPNASRIFVPVSSIYDTKKIFANIFEIFDLLQGLMTLNIVLPDLSKAEIRAAGIPTLEEKRPADATALTNGPQKLSSTVVETTRDTEIPEMNETATKSNDNDETTTVWSKTTSPSSTVQTENEDRHTPEQSNSEDSSLSYSDRTLVGEGDASEDDDYPPNMEYELFRQLMPDNGKATDPSEYVFKVTRDEHEPQKLLRVLLDNKMTLGTLKKLLEPHIGVPMEHFRVFSYPTDENEYTRLTMQMGSHDDGGTLWINHGLAMRIDEFKVSLYQLCLDSETEPYKFLCEWIVSKDATVGQTKKEILAELKRKFDIDIPFERCRFRRKHFKTAANVFLDDEKIRDIQLSWPKDIIIQELPGKETIVDSTDVVIFARRMPRPGVRLGPIQELIISDKSLSKVRETASLIDPMIGKLFQIELSEMSGIPEEYLEMAKGKSSLPDDLMQLILQNFLDWNRQLSSHDDYQPIIIEDGTVIYYRDSRDQPHELSAAEVRDMHRTKPRVYDVPSSSTSSRYSPRRERALKIYVDDM